VTSSAHYEAEYRATESDGIVHADGLTIDIWMLFLGEGLFGALEAAGLLHLIRELRVRNQIATVSMTPSLSFSGGRIWARNWQSSRAYFPSSSAISESVIPPSRP